MDKKLNIVRHLYGEADDRSERRMLLQDEEVAREYQAMSEVKFALDHRPRHRPDPRTLQTVLAAAEAGEAPAVARRTDRGPVRQRLGVRRAAAGLATASVALVLGLAVWWQPWALDEAEHSEAVEVTARADRSELEAAIRSQQGRDPLALDSSGLSVQAGSTALMPAGAVVDPGQLWDAADEVRRLHLRIEMLQQQRLQVMHWDEPVRPFGELPASFPRNTSRSGRP